MKILLLGAGGHARSCISCLEQCGIEVVGLLDRPDLVGQCVSGHPILGTDEELGAYVGSVDGFLVAFGHLGGENSRMDLFHRILSLGGKLPGIITADAFVDRTARIGEGTIVMHRAFLNAGVSVGANGIINTGAIVEHDTTLGDNVHVSTGAILNGGARVGHGSFIGSGAVVRQNTTVGSGVIVGAGAVVVNDLLEPGTYAGVPARRIK